MHYEPTLEAAAGAIPREGAEVEVGVASGLIARVILRVAPRVDNQGPLADSPSGRRVTFREPKVEPNSEGGVENCLPEPPILDVETGLGLP